MGKSIARHRSFPYRSDGTSGGRFQFASAHHRHNRNPPSRDAVGVCPCFLDNFPAQWYGGWRRAPGGTPYGDGRMPSEDIAQRLQEMSERLRCPGQGRVPIPRAAAPRTSGLWLPGYIPHAAFRLSGGTGRNMDRGDGRLWCTGTTPPHSAPSGVEHSQAEVECEL